MPEVVPAVEQPQPTLDQVQEVLMPDLAKESFTLGDQHFKIRMLPIFYEKVVLRLVGSNWEGLQADAPLTQFVGSLVDKLPEIVGVICYDQGAMGAKRDEDWNEETFRKIVAWIERRACTSDLLDIVKAQLQKNRLGDLVEGLLAQGKGIPKLGDSLSTQP